MKARLIAALIVSIAMTASASGAAAQGAGTTRGPGGIKDTSPQQRPQDLSVMLFIPWWYGIGAGVMARYEIPIVPDGFIPAINDQFSLEPSLGIDFRRAYGDYAYFDRDGDLRTRGGGRQVGITPALYGMWSFHITSKFRPYASIGLGVTLGFETGDDDWPGSPHDFFLDTAIGMFFRFSDAAAFRAELGSGGPKVGFSFFF